MSIVLDATVPTRHGRRILSAARCPSTSFRVYPFGPHHDKYRNRHNKFTSVIRTVEKYGTHFGQTSARRRGALIVVTAYERGCKQQVGSTLLPEPQIAALSDENHRFETPKHQKVSSNDLAELLKDECTSCPGIDVFAAEEVEEFRVAAGLRAKAFYEDLEQRQALPFPSRFIATFTREFAQRELRALQDRTSNTTNQTRRCVCLVAGLSKRGIVGCLDLSERSGPCASQVNGVCVGVDENYVYIDNVAVNRECRRRGIASALLEASSGCAIFWGASCVYTHVHADNVAARRLYHSYGFRAPKGKIMSEVISEAKDLHWTSPRLAGLVLLRAELPLKHKQNCRTETKHTRECTCGASYNACEQCICLSTYHNFGSTNCSNDEAW